MGAIVADDGETFQPSAQKFVLGHVEITNNMLHQSNLFMYFFYDYFLKNLHDFMLTC